MIAPSELTDDELDGLLPEALWRAARVHFTPVAVARRAVALLAPAAGATVLDVGAGVGKFCIAAALAAPTVRFVGIEQRAHLVELGRALARQLGATNVELIVGDALAHDWRDAAAVYLFNPFGEHADRAAPGLDGAIAPTPTQYFASRRAARDRLAALRPGTRVASYCDDRVPPGYDLVAVDDRLVVWRRRGVSAT